MIELSLSDGLIELLNIYREARQCSFDVAVEDLIWSGLHREVKLQELVDEVEIQQESN